MKQYRKKPVVIEAIQWDGKNWADVLMFAPITDKKDDELFIETLEGKMHITKNDYIIKGVQGEFYPCKPDIFKQTYEEI